MRGSAYGEVGPNDYEARDLEFIWRTVILEASRHPVLAKLLESSESVDVGAYRSGNLLHFVVITRPKNNCGPMVVLAQGFLPLRR